MPKNLKKNSITRKSDSVTIVIVHHRKKNHYGVMEVM